VSTDTLVTRLRAASNRLAALRPSVEATGPWPLSDDFGTAPEASWGPPEILAHVAEMLPFWLGEVERILAGPGAQVPFGRVATDQLRLLVLERDRSLPPRELFDRIAMGSDRVGRRLESLTPRDTERRGVHPARGEMTVEALADRFIVSHLEEHAEQLATVVAAPPGGRRPTG
jgi:DinB family protein